MRHLGPVFTPLLAGLALGLMAFSLAAAQPGPERFSNAPAGSAPASNAPAVDEALHWLTEPPHFDAEYNFELTVDIRLLVFWTAKDDVGGGYIKVGEAADDPSLEVIRLLFGSDPAKAHGINRWGAGTEVARRGPGGTVESSAFFGFMKSSQADSAGAMQQELSSEKQQGQYRFEAVISRVDPGRALSTTVPFYSGHDFDFRDLEPAEQTVLEEIQNGQSRQSHVLNESSACSRSNGFLSTVQELAGDALNRQPAPISRCYVYNSREYTLTLTGFRPVAARTIRFTQAYTRQKVERRYRDLEEARFEVLNHASGKKTDFMLLLGTTGGLRGAPVQIDYQPNWWFRITLNLMPSADSEARVR